MYWNLTDKERLVKALLLADNNGLMKGFLEDMLTKKELKNCIKRLRALCLLNDGASYSEIERSTGLSSRTIARLCKKYSAPSGAIQKILRKFKSMGPTYSD